MKIAVLAYLATYGNAPLVAAGCAALGHDVRLILRYRNKEGQSDYGFADEYPHWEIEKPEELKVARQWVADADRLIVHAMPSLRWLVPRLLDKPTDKRGAIILTSSHLMLGLPWERKPIEKAGVTPVDWNLAKIRASGYMPFVQPHKRVYVESLSPEVYYPPIIARMSLTGCWPIQIGHSPGKEGRHHWKGTEAIADVFQRVNAVYGERVYCQILPEMEHAEVIERRRRMHIFVDQVCPSHPVEGGPDYWGGLDKSGLEAMGVGCVVVSSGGPFDCEADPPPVLYSDAEGLYDALRSMIDNRGRMKNMAAEGQRWIQAHCEPRVVAARILRAIA